MYRAGRSGNGVALWGRQRTARLCVVLVGIAAASVVLTGLPLVPAAAMPAPHGTAAAAGSSGSGDDTVGEADLYQAHLALQSEMAAADTGPGVPEDSSTTTTSRAAFDAGNLISDADFYHRSAMSEAEIQSFLQAMVGSCSNAYCLADYVQDTPTRTWSFGTCATYPGAAGETAARIIFKTQEACGLSAKVILVTLQKEQSLLTNPAPSPAVLQKAMGYGCPDNADCDSTYHGFFNQVFAAARQLTWYGNPGGSFTWLKVGQPNPILFHPNESCRSAPVLVQNAATAALYYYTPYQPNAAALANMNGTGDHCSAYGNRNFSRFYTTWFGAPTTTAPTITGTPMPGSIGDAYAFTFQSTGNPPPTVTLAAGTLPPGLELSPTGHLSGHTTTAGVFPISVTAANGTSPDATLETSITVTDPAPGVLPPTISGTPATGTVHDPYDFQFTLGGRPAPTVTVTAGELPPGLSLTSTGRLAGTPTMAGTFLTTLTASNGTTPDATHDILILITDAPLISGTPHAAVVGTPYEYQFTLRQRSVPTTTITSGALPNGLTLSNTGRITGTPTEDGTFPFTVTADDGHDTSEQLTAITITPAAAIRATVLHEAVRAGQTQTVIGHGFSPNEQATLTITTTDTAVGTATATAEGRITYEFTIPNDLPHGTHILEVAAERAGTTTVEFTVIAATDATAPPSPAAPADRTPTTTPSTSTTSSLAETGMDTPAWLVAVATLVFAGAGLLLATRIPLSRPRNR